MDPARDRDPSGMEWESMPEGILGPSPRKQLPSAMIANAVAREFMVHRVDMGMPSPGY